MKNQEENLWKYGMDQTVVKCAYGYAMTQSFLRFTIKAADERWFAKLQNSAVSASFYYSRGREKKREKKTE